MIAIADTPLGADLSAEQTVTAVTASQGERPQTKAVAHASPLFDSNWAVTSRRSVDRRCFESVTAMNELPLLEPIPLPDVTSLDFVPPLPAWVETRIAALSRASDVNKAGHYCNGPWIPVDLMPTSAQRATMVRHVDALRELMEQTPERDKAARNATLGLVTKLLQVLPSPRATAAAIDARCEAFMMALETDPHWAVAAAIRNWYRGRCGKKHDYRWQPAPAVLHDLAQREAWKIKGRIQQLEDVLNADTPLTFSDEHRARMLRRLAQEIPVILGTQHALRAETTGAL